MIQHYNQHHQPGIHRQRLTLSLTIGLLLGSVSTANAALSSVTAKTIEGTPPYFNLNGVALTNTSELLGFTYTKPDGTAGKATADDAVNNVNIEVSSTMNMVDIKAVVGIDDTAHSLASVLGGAGGLTIGDIDGDASIPANTSAVGDMKAYWTKDGVVYPTPGATEKLNACSVYQLTIAITNPGTGVIASSAGNIEALTTYGAPNKNQYAYPASAGSPPTNVYSVTYNVIPNVTMPYACWAQPNLTYGTGDASYPDWDSAKGFKAAPTTPSSKTFPTTGFHGAFFNLTVANTTAAKIITDTPVGTLTSNGVTVNLSTVIGQPNVVKVSLSGPSSTTAPTGQFASTTFNLKSGANTVYSFTLENWFITKNVNMAFSTGSNNSWNTSLYDPTWGWNGSLDTPNYCKDLGGAGKGWYKVPTRLQYTNSASASITAWNGTPGTGGSAATSNNYRRMIGGGLFTEWGYINVGYPQSEFVNTYYWASGPHDASLQYIVHLDDGHVSGFYPSYSTFRAACVSP